MLQRTFVAALSAGLTAAGLAFAQTPAAPQSPAPSAQRPIFRSGVDLVRLDIRVADGDGRPIPDLRPEELQIVEAGVTRPVLLFQRVAESGRSYFESAQQTIASEVSTNQGAPRGQLYVLLFDQDHITPGAEQRVRQAAETFLRERVRPQDRVAVYGLPVPGPAQPLTAKVDNAIAALQHVRGGLERTSNGAVADMKVHDAYEIVRGNESVLERLIARPAGTDATSTSGAVVAADLARRGGEDGTVLRQLLTENARTIVARADSEARNFLQLAAAQLLALRDIAGRKTVLLFSEGFHADNVAHELEALEAAAAETYSVVYAFDLNRRFDAVAQEANGAGLAAEISSRLDPLGGLAAETDGALFLDAMSALRQSFDTVSAQSGDYYIVGFEPSPTALSDRGGYRRVDVRVTRPGAHVKQRTGYAAGPAPTLADRRRAIDAAFAGPFSEQGLVVEYTTYVTRSDTPSVQSVVVSLAAELPVRQKPGEFADVVFVVKNSRTGQVASSGSDRIALPGEAREGSLFGRGEWRVRFDVPAGSYLMRCVVREPGGVVGSADRAFTVGALGGPDPAASDLILGSRADRLAVRAVGYTEGTLSGVLRVYARTPEQLAKLTARLDLVAMTTAEPASSQSVEGLVGDLRQNGAGVMRDVTFALPVSALAPGDYVARAIVRADSEMVADLRRQFEIVAGPPPPVEAPPAARPRDVLQGDIAGRLLHRAAESSRPEIRQAGQAALAGRWADVQTTIDRLAASNDPEVERLGALASLAREDYGAAAAALTRQSEAEPGDAGLAFVLGWARLGEGGTQAAAAAFEQAARLEPTMVPAYLAAAEAYVQLQQPARAIQALEAGLAKVPNSTELKRMLEKIKT